MNAAGTFMGIMYNLFADSLGQFMWIYINDILIDSDREQDHLKHIAMVCHRLKQGKFCSSRKRSELFATSMDLLGHIIAGQGSRASPEKITRIEAWITPKNKKQLQEFLRVVNTLANLNYTWRRSEHP